MSRIQMPARQDLNPLPAPLIHVALFWRTRSFGQRTLCAFVCLCSQEPRSIDTHATRSDWLLGLVCLVRGEVAARQMRAGMRWDGDVSE